MSKDFQDWWNKHHKSELKYVVGDVWWAGNISYHLKSRPIWIHKDDLEKIDCKIVYREIKCKNRKDTSWSESDFGLGFIGANDD